jgi:hypothetical protein
MWTDENGNTTFGKLQEMFGQNFKLDQCILLNYTQNKNVPHYGYVRSPNDPRAVHPLYINGKMELQNSVPSHLVPISIDTKQYIPRQRVLGKKLPQRLQSMFHYAQHGYQ